MIDKGGRTGHRRTVLPVRPRRQAGDERRRPDLDAPQANGLEAPRAKFLELRHDEVRRIPLLGTSVNKGKMKSRSLIGSGLSLLLSEPLVADPRCRKLYII